MLDMKSLKVSEREIQKSITEYLRLKKYMVIRLNSGSFPLGEGKNRRFFRSCEPGTPDLMAFKEGNCDPAELGSNDVHAKLYFIEVKAGKNKATQLQLDKMAELAVYGATCIIAHSVEELQEAGL